MTTRAQKIRLGVFLLISVILFVTTVTALIGLTLLNPRDLYYVRYRDSVGGLTSGSTVKMKGVAVGQVENLTITDQGNEVLVTLALQPGTPIRQGTKAVITSIGITGIKEIELSPGGADGTIIEPNQPESIILPGDSVIQSLTGKAMDIGKKTEQVLNNLLVLTDDNYRTRVKSLLDNADRLANGWATLVEGNNSRIQRILASVDRGAISLDKAAAAIAQVTSDNRVELGEMIGEINRAAHSLSRILQTLHPQTALDQVSAAARSIRERVDDPALGTAIKSVSKAAGEFALLSSDLKVMVRSRDRQIESILRKLDDTMSNLKSFSQSIRDRPSLLIGGEAHRDREIP